MLTFSCRCVPTHPPVSPLARTQHWRWRVSRLPWLHPPKQNQCQYDKCIGESNPVLPRSAPRPGTGWCPRPCSAAPCGWWGGPWAQYCYETRVTRVTRHLMTTLMLSPSMSELSPVPSDLTDPLADLARDPALPGLQIKICIKMRIHGESLFFDISTMQFGCEWSKWRCWNDLRQIMTKGLQTVTSICQDTTEVQYTRPKIMLYAERPYTY